MGTNWEWDQIDLIGVQAVEEYFMMNIVKSSIKVPREWEQLLVITWDVVCGRNIVKESTGCGTRGGSSATFFHDLGNDIEIEGRGEMIVR